MQARPEAIRWCWCSRPSLACPHLHTGSILCFDFCQSDMTSSQPFPEETMLCLGSQQRCRAVVKADCGLAQQHAVPNVGCHLCSTNHHLITLHQAMTLTCKVTAKLHPSCKFWTAQRGFMCRICCCILSIHFCYPFSLQSPLNVGGDSTLLV